MHLARLPLQGDTEGGVNVLGYRRGERQQPGEIAAAEMYQYQRLARVNAEGALSPPLKTTALDQPTRGQLDLAVELG